LIICSGTIRPPILLPEAPHSLHSANRGNHGIVACSLSCFEI
jgi:hypothetical protein